ncbi:1,4-alpha-glucan branching enzyme [Arthrobacter sp. TE12232]
MLFMGEEYGASTPWQFFTSHPEPELGKATAEGRIREFERMGWDPAVVPDPQDPQTFTRSKLNWAEASEGDHARLLELYRALIALRRTTPDLTEPGFQDTVTVVSEEEGWLLFRRGGTEVAMNFSGEARRVPVSAGAIALATDDGVRLDPGAGPTSGGEPAAGRLHLPGHSAAILTN